MATAASARFLRERLASGTAIPDVAAGQVIIGWGFLLSSCRADDASDHG